MNLVWIASFVISVLVRLRQENLEFEVILDLLRQGDPVLRKLWEATCLP